MISLQLTVIRMIRLIGEENVYNVSPAHAKYHGRFGKTIVGLPSINCDFYDWNFYYQIKIVTYNMYEAAFKNIDDTLCKDAGCGIELDYIEQTSSQSISYSTPLSNFISFNNQRGSNNSLG